MLNNIPQFDYLDNKINNFKFIHIKDITYKVINFTVHIGPNQLSGHYINYVYEEEDNNWYECNDGTIKKVTDKQIEGNIVMLGYTKFDPLLSHEYHFPEHWDICYQLLKRDAKFSKNIDKSKGKESENNNINNNNIEKKNEIVVKDDLNDSVEELENYIKSSKKKFGNRRTLKNNKYATINMTTTINKIKKKRGNINKNNDIAFGKIHSDITEEEESIERPKN